MKVILAGYPKTGTKTMCAALSVLGYNTYDFLEHWWYHSKEWIKVLERGGTVEDFRNMYENVDAVTDSPAFYFWEEIHQAFPDAKIIFTTRDEDSWYKSFLKQRQSNTKISISTTLKFIAASTCLNPFKMWEMNRFCDQMMKVIFGSQMAPIENELVDRMHFRHHNAYVLQAAPKDKLLVYNVTDGWEPLCEFLGVDIPNQPFPRKNVNCSGADETLAENPIAIQNLRTSKRRACFVAATLLASFCAIKYYRRFI